MVVLVAIAPAAARAQPDAPATAATVERKPVLAGASQCPSPEAVWQELIALLPRTDLEARLGGPDGTLEVDDLGGSFRVALLGSARVYRDEGRDCKRRARMGALFAALVVDPSGQLATPTPPPPAPPAPPPSPPAVAPVPAPVAPPAARLRVELGPAVSSGLDGQAGNAAWGGALRIAIGGRLAVVAGGVVGWPASATMGGVALRQWRLPVDLGVRATAPLGVLVGYAELGLVVALLRERALELALAKAATAVTLGGRLALGARLAQPAWSPFVQVALEVVPDPPRVVALPAGEVGRTFLWLAAVVGVSWGPRWR